MQLGLLSGLTMLEIRISRRNQTDYPFRSHIFIKFCYYMYTIDK